MSKAAESKMLVTMTTDELEALVERAAAKALSKQHPAQDQPRYVDVKALATHFDVHRTTVITWVKEGCPHLQRGKVVRFELAAVEAWMRGREPGLRRVK